MKKTYINPTMEVVNIKTNTQLLAGSPVGWGSGNVDPGSADSRWFDDEDE